MKKILLGTSAIALAGAFASSASASEWSMDVGGFFTGGIGIVSDEIWDDQSMVIISDSEIHFDPSITLDNGLTFSAHVELEANADSDQVDEHDMSVKGSFGEIRIGNNDGAQDKFSGGLPCPTFACTDDGYFDRTNGLSFGVDGSNSSDNTKISYFSPSFSGFQAGVSYVPSDNGDDNGRRSNNNDADSFEAGAKYAGSFGDFSVNLGFGYYHDGNASSEYDDNFGVTGGVGFGGFSIGLGYQSDAGGEDKNWGIAGSYDTGPWNFGVYYGQADYQDSDDWNAGVGVSYAVAAGVTVGATAEFGEVEDEDISAGGLFIGLSF